MMKLGELKLNSNNVVDITKRFKSESIAVEENKDDRFKFGINDDTLKVTQYLLDTICIKAQLFYPNLQVEHIKQIAPISLRIAFSTMKENKVELYLYNSDMEDELKVITYYDEAINIALFTLVEYIKTHKDEFL